MSYDRRTLIERWIEKANGAIQSAEILLEENQLSGAVNRLYYAVFYAMTAVLTTDGATFRKHTGVRAALHRDYVKPGRMPEEQGQVFNVLFDARQESDYAPLENFDAEYVELRLKEAREFVDWCKRYTSQKQI